MFVQQVLKSLVANHSKAFQKLLPCRTTQPKSLLKRMLHVTPQDWAKIYVDRENVHAHQVLEHSSKSYQLFTMQGELSAKHVDAQNVAQLTAENAVSVSEMFDNFKAICDHCRQTNSLISSDQYRDFVLKFCDITHKLTDSQLKESLWALSQLPEEDSVRSPNYVELWNNLDIECCRRIEKWRTDELLLICDAWYKLNLTRVCDFVWEALRKLGRKVVKMQPQQLVQTMFLCNVMRRAVLDMFDFEANLSKSATHMTLAELGVMSMGFFKTQTPIRNPKLISYLYERLMDELVTVDDITFVAILKVLRYSSKLNHVDEMQKLMDKIYTEKSDQLNLLTALHAALLGCDLQCCHEGLIEKIVTQYCQELDAARLKDLERISFVLALFNIQTTSKIENTLSEKILLALPSRIDEIMKYPKCLTNCLHFLTLRGYHDNEMISTVLDRKFLKHAHGTKLAMSREIFHLDTFVEINLQHDAYEGNRLEEKYRKVMGKMLTHYIPERNSKFKINATDNILLQIKEAAEEVLPFCQLMHILPNYERSDLVLLYDRSTRKSIPIAQSCPEHYSGTILTRDILLDDRNHNDIDTVAIVIAGWNNVVRDKNRHTGLLDMKLKQLKLLGHKPVLIYWHEWRELRTQQQRVLFVKQRLSDVISL